MSKRKPELLSEQVTNLGIRVRVYKDGLVEHVVMKSNSETWFPELEDEKN